MKLVSGPLPVTLLAVVAWALVVTVGLKDVKPGYGDSLLWLIVAVLIHRDFQQYGCCPTYDADRCLVTSKLLFLTLLYGLIAFGQIRMRRIDGYQHLSELAAAAELKVAS